jgi:hypothetical protein
LLLRLLLRVFRRLVVANDAAGASTQNPMVAGNMSSNAPDGGTAGIAALRSDPDNRSYPILFSRDIAARPEALYRFQLFVFTARFAAVAAERTSSTGRIDYLRPPPRPLHLNFSRKLTGINAGHVPRRPT